MASLGTEFAMLLLVSGNWHALAKLETELKRLAETQQPQHSPEAYRAACRAPRTCSRTQSMWSVSIRPASFSGLSGFFSSRGIDIAEVSTRSYPAAHTGAPMFSVADDRQRTEPYTRRTPARGVHGVLRLAQPGCNTRNR